MPPRYAYWTILVDDQPTAFRAGAQDDLMPTFKRLQEKHPSAKMMWFQNGKLWNSRLDAQEAMSARGEIGRRRDARQEGGFRDRRPRLDRNERPEWKPKGTRTPGSRIPDSGSRRDKPGKLEWKPKGSAPPRSDRAPMAKPAWRPKGDERRKLEWKPKGESTKRKWVPKEEYKKSKGIEARRDRNWRPGGEHKDPRQKYKDAKKAKWGRFKQTIRKRWETKKKSDK